jgi:protoporphyrin/coproporphyrin ferrochelatase
MTGDDPAGRTAILLMGYGSPSGAADLPGYLAEVLGGRVPPPEMVAEYRRRYERIGGSPQNRILTSLRTKVEHRLAETGTPRPVYLGTKHWTPHLADVVPQIAADGYHRVVAIPLSPYASTWILNPYREALERGRAAASRPVAIEVRAGWHLNPHLTGYWADALQRELARVDDPSACALLSAHSLPQRMRDAGDPYPELLVETAEAIARSAGLTRWAFTYQSAGNTTEPWLGPDITEVMAEWRDRGAMTHVVASIGFIFDHLEVLYDLDVVVRAFAAEHGIAYRRVPMPNDQDALVAALADVARATPGPA